MISLINKQAPDFEVEAYLHDNFSNFKLSDYKGKYVLLFFYPFDFTFVCPTEIVNFSEISPLFKDINCGNNTLYIIRGCWLFN